MQPSSPPLSGWHPEDVKAAIRKRGITLTGLAYRHGLSESYLRNTLLRPMQRGEQIIATFLRVPAKDIWPDRYDQNGQPDYRRWRASRLHPSRRAA